MIARPRPWPDDVRYARALGWLGFVSLCGLALLASGLAVVQWLGVDARTWSFAAFANDFFLLAVVAGTCLAPFAVRTSPYARAGPLAACLVVATGQLLHMDGRSWPTVPALASVFVVPGLVLRKWQGLTASILWLLAVLVDFFWSPGESCEGCGVSNHAFLALVGMPVYAVVAGLLAASTFRWIQQRNLTARKSP